MPTVELTRHLHSFFPQFEEKPVEVEGTTVAEVVKNLEALAPGIAFYICDEKGRLRMHVNIFVNNERIRDRGTLSDRLEQGDRVHIIQALSGG